MKYQIVYKIRHYANHRPLELTRPDTWQDSRVADGWAGAVMREPPKIHKM